MKRPRDEDLVAACRYLAAHGVRMIAVGTLGSHGLEPTEVLEWCRRWTRPPELPPIARPARIEDVWTGAGEAARAAFADRLPPGFLARLVGLGITEDAIRCMLAFALAHHLGHRRVMVGGILRPLGDEWELAAFVERMERLTLRRPRKGAGT